MKLYEYQAKTLFESFHVPKSEGLFSPDLTSLPAVLKKMGPPPWAIKAQVLTGGRGKAGGVKLISSSAEAKTFVKHLFSKPLVTHQTGPKGEKVRGVLVEKTQKNIVREMYVSILLDRNVGCPVLIAAAEGGMDIETLAKTKPSAILRYIIDPEIQLPLYKSRRIAHDMGLRGRALLKGAQFLTRLSRVFFGTDATMVEVNPMVITEKDEVVALDGKVTIDDNAVFRHPDLLEWKKSIPLPSSEKRANKANLSYIQLDGHVGCLVNGAGLAMATMDIIKLAGGEPANFLDVGGGAKADQVAEAFKIILSDKQVKAVLVNIFGGIMRCDVIAEGIIAATKQVKPKVPLVVRLEGTKAKEGKDLLSNSNLAIITATSLTEAAQKVVEKVTEGN